MSRPQKHEKLLSLQEVKGTTPYFHFDTVMNDFQLMSFWRMIKSTMSVYGIIVTSPVQVIGSILYNQVGSTLPILAVENVLFWCTQFGKTSQLLQPEIWGKLIDLDF